MEINNTAKACGKAKGAELLIVYNCWLPCCVYAMTTHSHTHSQ